MAEIAEKRIEDRWRLLVERVETILEQCGRSGEKITIVGVAKGQGWEQVMEAIRVGLRHIGENRVQEAKTKIPMVSEALLRGGLGDLPIVWHMVGRLQSNKIPMAVRLFQVVQSVESEEQAELISHRGEKEGKVVEVWMEVNTSGEPTKGGVPPSRAHRLGETLLKLPNIHWKGLMTIGPLTNDKGRVRMAFRALRHLGEQLTKDLSLSSPLGLSMGMSDDYPIALEEGATLIRIGTALFGPRSYDIGGGLRG